MADTKKDAPAAAAAAADAKDKAPAAAAAAKDKDAKTAPAAAAVSTALSTAVAEHPLETPWAFHFTKKLQPGQDYQHYAKSLQTLGQFATVEQFWRHYSWLQSPDDIPRDHDLSLFRAGCVPAWESYPTGGCWIIKVRKRNGAIRLLWEHLVFACVGELFGDVSGEVAGVMLSTRLREDNLSVWNRDNSKPKGEAIRFKIGETMREILHLDPSIKVDYKFFSDAMRDGSTFRNAQAYQYQPSPQMAPQLAAAAAGAPSTLAI